MILESNRENLDHSALCEGVFIRKENSIYILVIKSSNHYYKLDSGFIRYSSAKSELFYLRRQLENSDIRFVYSGFNYTSQRSISKAHADSWFFVDK